jgi:hypothetical protein
MPPRLFLGLLLAATFAVVQHSGASGDQVPTSRLPLTVRADQKVYSLHEKLYLETQVTNVSQETVYLNQWDLCWGQGPALSLSVVDSSGNTVGPGFLLDCIPPPPKPGDMSACMRLNPHMFLGSAHEFVVRDLVNKPGNYTFKIQSGSALTAEWLAEAGFPKLPYWTREDRPIATEMHISVGP